MTSPMRCENLVSNLPVAGLRGGSRLTTPPLGGQLQLEVTAAVTALWLGAACRGHVSCLDLSKESQQL